MATSVTLIGSVQYVAIGTGAWAIVVAEGESYEIYNGEPIAIQREGAKVTITGFIRDDVMSFAAIGPIVEVISFEFD